MNNFKDVIEKAKRSPIYKNDVYTQILVDEIEQLVLIPPTQEEVCRQLSERTKLSVYYSNGKFMFHSDVYGLTLDLNDLSHDDIILIGRFYQGVKE